MNFKRVLVTGAAGLLGRQVVVDLAAHCEVVALDRTRGQAAVEWHEADILDAEQVRHAAKGCDAIIHIAAVPNIGSAPADRLVEVNVLGTWNVLRAAELAGTRRFVLCSSDSVVGFTVAAGCMHPPLYLPVDEAHPLRPTDTYALSKKLGEEMARSFADRGILEVAVLRPVFIAHPESLPELQARAKAPAAYTPGCAGGAQPAGGGPVWHHVDPRDAARAFRLALELRQLEFDIFFISAEVTLAPKPTLDQLRGYLHGNCPEVRKREVYDSNPYAPLYDLSRARAVLGFTAEHDARAISGVGSAPASAIFEWSMWQPLYPY